MSEHLARRCVKALIRIGRFGDDALIYSQQEARETAGEPDFLDVWAQDDVGAIAGRVPDFVCDDGDLVWDIAVDELFGSRAVRYVEALERIADEYEAHAAEIERRRNKAAAPTVKVQAARRRA